MTEHPSDSQEIRRIYRLLRQTAKMAREVSMTGSLERGAPRAVQQFNRVVQRIEDLGAVPPTFFPRLNEEASMDEVGVASVQLAGYLDEGQDHASQSAGEGPLFGSLVISHLGSLQELEDLRRMRQTIRENHPDLLRQFGADQSDTAPQASAPDADRTPGARRAERER